MGYIFGLAVAGGGLLYLWKALSELPPGLGFLPFVIVGLLVLAALEGNRS